MHRMKPSRTKLVLDPSSAGLVADFMVRTGLLGQFKAIQEKRTQLDGSESGSDGGEEH
jgi:hypothetical protein